MFDLKNNIELVECLNAIVKTADTNASAVDTQGANSAKMLIQTALVLILRVLIVQW